GNLPTGYSLAIMRRVEILQQTDIQNQTTYHPETLEEALDRGTMVDQQQQEEIGRALKLRDTDDASGSGGVFDAHGNAVANLAMRAAAEPTDAANVDYVQQYADGLHETALHLDETGEAFDAKAKPIRNGAMTAAPLTSDIPTVGH